MMNLHRVEKRVVIKFCLNCNKQLEGYAPTIIEKKKFCSVKCRTEYNRKQTELDEAKLFLDWSKPK